MRSKFLPLVVIAGMTFGGAAFAGTTATTATAPAATAATTTKATKASMPMTVKDVSGTIKKINTKAGYVVLSNGIKYHLPKGFSLTEFKVGQKVSVSYEMKGKLHEATAMKAA